MKNIFGFIRARQIDSIQKLHLLLFLQHHPKLEGTCQELAAQLHWHDTGLLEKIATDLHSVGLLVCHNQCWKLSDEPGIRSELEQLAGAFEHPLTRQRLLEQIGSASTRNYNPARFSADFGKEIGRYE